MLHPSSLVAALLLVTALTAGCASRTPLEVSRDLSSLDDVTRLDAARCLEREASERGLSSDVVDALLAQAPRETDPAVRASLMRALGTSGDVRAKLILDAYAQTDDRAQRAVASQALQAWAVATGHVPAGYAFPAEWPYGTEAYPPRK